MNNLLLQFRRGLLMLCASLICTSAAYAAAITYPLNLKMGWNLLGNSLSTPIDVKTSFGTQANVVTLWKWNVSSSTWAFYAPSLDANTTLASYAASKGYSVLNTINPGEGYWVNATAASALGDQSGSVFALNPANLRLGWNLSATGDEVTPAAFSTSVNNVTTLWAWNSANSGWYFYAPSLSASSTLASYIASKGYQDFGLATLGDGRGFWVNSTGPVNLAPVANAGAAQNVVAGSTVTLNGAASSDANNEALTYAWTLTSKPTGSAAALTNATAVAPTFVADKAGSYVATLVVNDGKLNSPAATITVTVAVANVAPVADAGVAQNVVAGNLVTLDGSASSDANGDALTYAWTLTSRPTGSSAALASATSAKPTLTVDVAGTYVARLMVNDGKVDSAAATITVMAENAALAAPAGVAVANASQRSLVSSTGSSSIYSSSKLTVSWTAPIGYTVHHYEITAQESIFGTTATATATASEISKTITDLKAATPYAVTVKACKDSACARSGVSSAASGTTTEEYWQLQGSGSSVSGLTKLVSDGQVRISATRFGSDAGGATASRIQIYYGPSDFFHNGLATAVTSQATDAASAASYLSFTSMARTNGLISPATASTLVSIVATGQGVPLSAAMGGKVRLFFEAEGSDRKTRIMYLDSQDAYVGRDFNSGSATTCSTTTDYQSGGCVPTVAIGIAGDSSNANSKIDNARQFKLGFPILNDWRWDGAAGTFMVFTTGSVSGCSTSKNHGYAVWDGSKWNVQYDAAGCPKLFKSVQAMFPMHLGEARYKMYFGDPSITTGIVTSATPPGLPFLGPKKLIYADGRSSGAAAVVDFEDWESTSSARNVIFVWPNGDQLNDSAEGYIDDFHFMAPTASLDLQVMYLAITDGTLPPIAGSAILLNP